MRIENLTGLTEAGHPPQSIGGSGLERAEVITELTGKCAFINGGLWIA